MGFSVLCRIGFRGGVYDNGGEFNSSIRSVTFLTI